MTPSHPDHSKLREAIHRASESGRLIDGNPRENQLHEDRKVLCMEVIRLKVELAKVRSVAPATPARGEAQYDCKCVQCGKTIYQGVLCAECHSRLAQPPCDDAHVAPGCELFSDPTRSAPVNAAVQAADEDWAQLFASNLKACDIISSRDIERVAKQAIEYSPTEALRRERDEAVYDRDNTRHALILNEVALAAANEQLAGARHRAEGAETLIEELAAVANETDTRNVKGTIERALAKFEASRAAIDTAMRDAGKESGT